MSLIALYLVTFLLFLGLDFLGLRYLVRPTFEAQIGPMLLAEPRLGPAFLFYAFYVAVVIYIVSAPAISEHKSLLWVLGHAALLGAFGYGTYEFTNLATLRDWTWTMVVTDLLWGTALTAVSATCAVWLVRAFG